MVAKTVTLMINSTFYDMMAEYRCFIEEVYPRLKEECQKYDIEINYCDVAFSVPRNEADKGILLQDFRFIDMDRTFFICFRGQKLGWRPKHTNINGFTIDEYPELVGYIGNVSITELVIMHALTPFDRYVDGEKCDMKPAKHSLFYFRKSDYEKDLSGEVKHFYVNKSNGELKEILDLEVAKAKDLIFEIKHDLDKNSENSSRIIIRNYDATWDENLNTFQMFLDYVGEYSKIVKRPLDEFIEIHEEYLCRNADGALSELAFGGRPLGDVIYEDILNELKIEFPDNFK